VIKSIAIFAILLLSSLAAEAQDDIRIEMHIAPDTISIEDQAFLAITVTGSGSLPDPELPNLSMFEVSSQGTSTNISIVNGKMESTYAYNYMLFPKRQGTFVIKPASVVYKRKRYETKEVTLTVLDSGVGTPRTLEKAAKTSDGETRDIFLLAELNKKKVYVNEQVTLTIKFCYAVSLLSQPDYTPPQTTDFWSDAIEPQRSYYQNINGRRYNVIEINTALFPTRSGELNIGSAMVSVNVKARSRRRRDPFSMFDDFFDHGQTKKVRTKPLKIDVLPLPAENKPADYSGTVGEFFITSSIDKLKTEVNQPVTVTYKIRGTGNIKTVAEPEIEDLVDFRVYRAASSEKVSIIDGVVGGTKIFEETYIPKRAGQLAIPAVSLNYFNPRTGQYKTVSTKPINIDVAQAALSNYANIPVPRVAGRVIDDKAKDIRYIKIESGNLSLKQPLLITTPLYLILNGVPVLLFVLVWIGQKRKEKLSSDIGYARSRLARKLARKRLTAARKLANSGQTAKFYAEIRFALFAYIADKLNVSPHGLTGDKLLEIMKNSDIEEEIIGKTASLLRQADFAQYSSSNSAMEDVRQSLKSAEEILIKLEGSKIA